MYECVLFSQLSISSTIGWDHFFAQIKFKARKTNHKLYRVQTPTDRKSQIIPAQHYDHGTY